MPAHKKYDPRVDQLVVETRTFWDPEVGELSDVDRQWLAAAVHASPQHATKIAYERAHTGFTREITVTLADIERLYAERVAAG